MQQALDALNTCDWDYDSDESPHKTFDEDLVNAAAAALKEALAEPEQEPVAWRNAAIRLGEDLYSVGPDGYYDMTAKQWLDWALSVVNIAQGEQEEPLPLVDIGVDVTPEGTHVVACYNRPDAVQEMFYSQFHPLTKPEQEPKLSDAGADTNISRGLEPKGSGMVTLHQPVAWMMPDYGDVLSASEADGTGIYNVPLYTAPPKREWVGLTAEEIDAERWGRLESETFVKGVKWAEAKLKEKNT